MVQSPAIEWDGGLIRLTTTLVHASGEWVIVFGLAGFAQLRRLQHRMAAALTYALFALAWFAHEEYLMRLTSPKRPAGQRETVPTESRPPQRRSSMCNGGSGSKTPINRPPYLALSTG